MPGYHKDFSANASPSYVKTRRCNLASRVALLNGFIVVPYMASKTAGNATWNDEEPKKSSLFLRIIYSDFDVFIVTRDEQYMLQYH